MKKRLCISAFALGTATVLMTGLCHAATVDEVLENYRQATHDAKEFSVSADFDVDIDINISAEGAETQTASISAGGGLDGSITKDPLGLYVNLFGSLDALDQESMEGSVECYGQQTEDALDLYAAYAGEWQYLPIPAEEFSKIKDAVLAASDPSATIGTYTLGEGTVDINGTSCYELKDQITFEDVRPLIEQVMDETQEEGTESEDGSEESSAEATLSMLSIFLTNLYFNITTYVDVNTYLPVKTHIDMDGSDFSLLSTVLAFQFSDADDEGNFLIPDIALDVKDLWFEAAYDFESPVEINIPAEALAKKENGEGLDLSSLEESALSSIAG